MITSQMFRTTLTLSLALLTACTSRPLSANPPAAAPAAAAPTAIPATSVPITASPAATEPLPAAELSPMAGAYLFTEGPAVDQAGGVYFSDINAGRIYHWTPADAVTVFKDGLNGPNGLALDAAGNLIVCEGGAGRLIALDADGQITVIADQYNGQRFNEPNDLWLDAQGGMYFTDPAYQAPVAQGGEYVYYVAPDRAQVTRVITDLVRPNGIVGTADGQTLYVADHGAGQTYAYTLGAGGALTDKRLFVAAGSDGLEVDALGNVYLTNPSQVQIFTAAGQLTRTIPLPENPTNLAFAGADHQTLFITARTAVYTLTVAAGSAATPKITGTFTLTSPALGADGRLPVDYTCDGASATLPLAWSGAPAGTQAFAVVMHHVAGPADVHWYWVLYTLPASITTLAENVTGLGTLGTNSVNDRTLYSPPCSKGPGDKIYI